MHITYEFDELPLVTYKDLDAALLDGSVEVEFHFDAYGDFTDYVLGDITLTGYSRTDPRAGITKPFVIDHPSVLHILMVDALKRSDWDDKIKHACYAHTQALGTRFKSDTDEHRTY